MGISKKFGNWLINEPITFDIYRCLYLSFIMIDLLHVAISKEDKRGLATKLKRTLLQVGLGARPADDIF